MIKGEITKMNGVMEWTLANVAGVSYYAMGAMVEGSAQNWVVAASIAFVNVAVGFKKLHDYLEKRRDKKEKDKLKG